MPTGLAFRRTSGARRNGMGSRRRAIGAALIRSVMERALEAGAADIFLEVGVDNAAARGLYGRLGFREVGRRPAYYTPTGDALILRHALRPQA